MKINKINISQQRTVQMRQFEPATIIVSVEAQVDPGDNADTILAQIRKKVRDEVDAEANNLKRIRKESYDDEMEKSQ